MNNQSNNDYDKDLSWSENPEDTPFVNKEEQDEDEKQGTFTKLIKTTAMVILALVLLIFVGIAWFTMNENVGTNGMGVKAEADGFNLRVGSGTIGFYDLYKYLDPSLTGNSGTVTTDSNGGQVISWRLADGDTGVKPGSQGELKFDVLSNGSGASDLEYNIQIAAYVASTHPERRSGTSGTTIETEVVDGLREITSSGSSGSELNALYYINSHVMFFTGRNGENKDNYKYYGFISNKDEFRLALQNGSGTIYWIWPNTFGQIALDAEDTEYITGTPVLYKNSETYATDRQALKAYMQEKENVFFSGTNDYSQLIDTLYEKRDNPGPSGAVSYRTEFEQLSEGYNAADQTIGSYVDYMMIHMFVEMH